MPLEGNRSASFIVNVESNDPTLTVGEPLFLEMGVGVDLVPVMDLLYPGALHPTPPPLFVCKVFSSRIYR